MNYTLTRQEAAIILNISTRSVDRYIKAWKIRAQKQWRIVMLNEEDIENIKKSWNNEKIELSQVIITPEEQKKQEEKEKISLTKPTNQEKSSLENIYEDLRNEIRQKDKKIETLSMQLWKMEEVVKNSISMIEYKKSQFLIEEKASSIKSELEKERFEKEKLKMEISEKSKLNIILSIIVVILLLISGIIWWISL